MRIAVAVLALAVFAAGVAALAQDRSRTPAATTKPGNEAKPGNENKPGNESKPGNETKPANEVKPAQAAEKPKDGAVAPDRKVVKTDAEWKKLLSDKEYRILVKSETERAFTGEFWDHHEKGVYVCAASGVPLFSSDDKFDSGTGWPSFTRPIDPAAVEEAPDQTIFGTAIEVKDATTGFHLGHVFDDGPQPSGKRYCINSAALRFVPAAKVSK